MYRTAVITLIPNFTVTNLTIFFLIENTDLVIFYDTEDLQLLDTVSKGNQLGCNRKNTTQQLIFPDSQEG